MDFVRGASRSARWQVDYCFTSHRLRRAKISGIACELDGGAAVSTSRNDVQYIVTEFGVAELRGKSLRHRAKALIAISHPDFRKVLTKEAEDRGIL